MGYIDKAVGTPIWIVCIAALLIGAGFWFFGYKVVASLGNKVTYINPTRGFVINFATSITVLAASALGIPVSTTQCQLGATVGIALAGGDRKAVNWKQIGWVILGWMLTPPIAGLISGLLMAIGLYSPHMISRPSLALFKASRK